MLAYFALRPLRQWIPVLLGPSGGQHALRFGSRPDPGLHPRPELRATLERVSLISLGIGAIALAGFLAWGHE